MDKVYYPEKGIKYTRDCAVEGEPEMAALKMAVNGAFVLPDVSPVMGDAWGRNAADLGYPNGRVF